MHLRELPDTLGGSIRADGRISSDVRTRGDEAERSRDPTLPAYFLFDREEHACDTGVNAVYLRIE